jgi:hypothetical protein
VPAAPDLEVRQVDPDKIAVDDMNERVNQPLATEDLERSVAENGVVEPPVCRVRDEDGRIPYTVIQGQRRVAAAQAVQLDEIPILIGEFDDKTALTRSITENITANTEEVTTQARARAIWELYTIKVSPEDREQVPPPSEVSDWLGVSPRTASNWIAPLREEYLETNLNPRSHTSDSDSEALQLSDELQDVSAEKLDTLTRISDGDSESLETAVEKVVDENLSKADVEDVVEQVKTREDADAVTAVETVAETKQKAEDTGGEYLNNVPLDGDTATALEKAARDAGASKSNVASGAITSYLRDEGYL